MIRTILLFSVIVMCSCSPRTLGPNPDVCLTADRSGTQSLHSIDAGKTRWQATFITHLSFSDDGAAVAFDGSHRGALATGSAALQHPPFENMGGSRDIVGAGTPEWLGVEPYDTWLNVDGAMYRLLADGSLDFRSHKPTRQAAAGPLTLRFGDGGRQLDASMGGGKFAYAGSAPIISVATDPDSGTMLLGFGDRRIVVLHSADKSTQFETETVELTPRSLLLSTDGKRLCIGGEYLQVLEWPSMNSVASMIGGTFQQMTAIATSPDGQCVAASASGLYPMVSVWKLEAAAFSSEAVGARLTARLYLSPLNGFEGGTGSRSTD